jgi:hypothetical protein
VQAGLHAVEVSGDEGEGEDLPLVGVPAQLKIELTQ